MIRIYVNRTAIERNAVDRTDFPVFTVEDSEGHAHPARQVDILGPSRIVYDPHVEIAKAQAWIETDMNVLISDELSNGRILR